METLVHIGQHKTGTTSIQKFLQNNKEELINDSFYYTNEILEFSHFSHFILNVYALKTNRYSSMKDLILRKEGESFINELNQRLKDYIQSIYKNAEEKGCNKIIWTNEGLYLLNSVEEYRKLYDLFHPHSKRVTVLCCFRDKNSYKESYTKQLFKQQLSLSDNIDSYRYIKDDSWLLDYDRKKRLLDEVFDKSIYWEYDKEDNIRSFIDLIGLNTKLKTDIRLNVTK